MKKGTTVKVKNTAPHHAGREGTFQFYGTGPSKGTAVLKDEKQSSQNMECLFAVKDTDFICI